MQLPIIQSETKADLFNFLGKEKQKRKTQKCNTSNSVSFPLSSIFSANKHNKTHSQEKKNCCYKHRKQTPKDKAKTKNGFQQNKLKFHKLNFTMTKKECKFTLTCALEFISSSNPNLFSFGVLKNKNCYNCDKNNKPSYLIP